MTVPTEEIRGCRVAHDRLDATLADLTPDRLRAPSRLPDWTVGHVLAHLVGHGESVLRRLEAASQRELVEQYPGGDQARNAFIEEFSRVSPAELAERLTGTNARLTDLFDQVDPDVWDRPVLARGAHRQILAQDLPFSRWREVEVHLVDLGLGHEPSDWPEELTDRWLPSLIGDLRGRADPNELTAWLLGRGPAPDIGPWA